MAQIETWFRQDLMSLVNVSYIGGNVFSQDNGGNLVGVEVYNNGEPATLSGSISGNVIRTDGTTIAVEGSFSGNKAWIVLPADAYIVPGVISIIIKNTVSTQITTLAACVVNVYQSSTDTIVDPGTIIPSIASLIEEIEEAVASIPADYSSLWTSLAPAFSSSTAYAVGQYVTYNGGVYMFVEDHAAGTWSSSDVVSANIGTDLGNFKGAKNFLSLHAMNDYFMPITEYIKYFAVYGDLSQYQSTPNFNLTMIGYYASENRFYITINDGTNNVSFIKSYESMPTSGIEWLNLKTSTTLTNKSFACKVLVDWSKYDNEFRSTSAYKIPVNILDYNVFKSDVFYGDGFDLRFVPRNVTLSGTFTLNSGFNMQDGEILRGKDCSVSVGSSGQIAMNNNCRIENIRFIGDWEVSRTTEGDHYAPIIQESDLSSGDTDAIWGEGLTSDYAVIFAGPSYCYNNKILNCRFSNFDRGCITVRGGSHRNSGSFEISGNLFEDCRNAITIRGEFSRISANVYFRCIVALVVMAGNLNKYGEVFKGCDCAIYYPSGVTNGAHGESVGCELAHCGIASIYAKEITYVGDIYTGCHFVDAPIIAVTANYLMITAGKLDTYVKIASGNNCAIMGNMVSIDYIGQHPLYDVPASAYIKNNVPMRNATEAQVNNET